MTASLVVIVVWVVVEVEVLVDTVVDVEVEGAVVVGVVDTVTISVVDIVAVSVVDPATAATSVTRRDILRATAPPTRSCATAATVTAIWLATARSQSRWTGKLPATTARGRATLPTTATNPAAATAVNRRATLVAIAPKETISSTNSPRSNPVADWILCVAFRRPVFTAFHRFLLTFSSTQYARVYMCVFFVVFCWVVS